MDILNVVKASMPEDLLMVCAKFAPIKEYSDGCTIHNRGELKLGLSIIYCGQVKIGNYGLDGKYQHTATLSKADTFGEFTLFNNLPRTHHAMAVGATKVIQMSAAQFNQCSKGTPELSAYLLSSMGLKLHIALERLDDIQRLPTYIRLAKILLQHTDKQGHVDLRQKDLAEQLGITVLSCHKSIKKLAALTLLKTSYGSIHINNITDFTLWLEEKMSLGQL
ncbi:MAG: CRP-like cAMP-binding protein [Arenicella sp.]|jgi:CRP-like cAMP-binding protein